MSGITNRPMEQIAEKVKLYLISSILDEELDDLIQHNRVPEWLRNCNFMHQEFIKDVRSYATYGCFLRGTKDLFNQTEVCALVRLILDAGTNTIRYELMKTLHLPYGKVLDLSERSKHGTHKERHYVSNCEVSSFGNTSFDSELLEMFEKSEGKTYNHGSLRLKVESGLDRDIHVQDDNCTNRTTVSKTYNHSNYLNTAKEQNQPTDCRWRDEERRRPIDSNNQFDPDETRNSAMTSYSNSPSDYAAVHTCTSTKSYPNNYSYLNEIKVNKVETPYPSNYSDANEAKEKKSMTSYDSNHNYSDAAKMSQPTTLYQSSNSTYGEYEAKRYKSISSYQNNGNNSYETNSTNPVTSPGYKCEIYDSDMAQVHKPVTSSENRETKSSHQEMEKELEIEVKSDTNDDLMNRKSSDKEQNSRPTSTNYTTETKWSSVDELGLNEKETSSMEWTNSETIFSKESSVDSTWSPRSSFQETKNAGLRNLGNTCYMNSVLQCLSVVPWDRIQDCETKGNNAFVTEFLELMSELKNGDSGAISPNQLKKVINSLPTRFATYEQQDAHEFLTFILSTLLENLSESGIKNFHKLFCGSQENITTFLCRGDHVTTTVQDLYTISLPVQIPQPVTVEHSIEVFLAKEDLEDMARCSECKDRFFCRLEIFFKTLPEILILHLKKFDFKKREKLDVDMRFPFKNLQLEASSGMKHIYDLHAISNHSGSLRFGHYTAYVKTQPRDREFDSNPTDTWFEYNDSCVWQAWEENIKYDARRAYLLFYKLSINNYTEE